MTHTWAFYITAVGLLTCGLGCDGNCSCTYTNRSFGAALGVLRLPHAFDAFLRAASRSAVSSHEHLWELGGSAQGEDEVPVGGERGTAPPSRSRHGRRRAPPAPTAALPREGAPVFPRSRGAGRGGAGAGAAEQLAAPGGGPAHARRRPRCQFRLFVREVAPAGAAAAAAPRPCPPPSARSAARGRAPAMARDYDHLFKLLIIGDSGERGRRGPGAWVGRWRGGRPSGREGSECGGGAGAGGAGEPGRGGLPGPGRCGAGGAGPSRDPALCVNGAGAS